MLDTSSPEIRFALNAVRQACRLVRQVQAEMVTTALTKDDRSPVTVADYASQALVVQLLQAAFPADVLVAEEDAAALQRAGQAETLEKVTRFVARFAPQATPQVICQWIDYGAGEPGGRFWTLDPIDGTKGFLRGDQYAVALALLEGGQVRLGVLGCPNLQEARTLEVGGEGSLVVAVRGQGAWTTPIEVDNASPLPDEDALRGFTRLRTSDVREPEQARLLRSYEAGHTNVDQLERIAREMSSQAEPVRLDSQAKYALLASGGGDLLLRLLSPSAPDYREKIWDQAAGSLVAQEAGGKVTDLDGKPLDFSAGRTLARNRGLLASNRHLHEAALQAIRSVGA